MKTILNESGNDEPRVAGPAGAGIKSSMKIQTKVSGAFRQALVVALFGLGLVLGGRTMSATTIVACEKGSNRRPVAAMRPVRVPIYGLTFAMLCFHWAAPHGR